MWVHTGSHTGLLDNAKKCCFQMCQPFGSKFQNNFIVLYEWITLLLYWFFCCRKVIIISYNKVNFKLTYLPSLDSLSSLRSEVKTDLALLVMLVFFDIELKFDGTGDGVLLTDAGLEVDWPDGVGFPVEEVLSLGAEELLPFWGVSTVPLELDGLLLSSAAFRDLWGLFWDCNFMPSVIEFTRDACEWDMFSLAKTRSWWASYSSRLG